MSQKTGSVKVNKTQPGKGKSRVTFAELKRQSFLVITAALFFIYGVIFYYVPLGGWVMAFQNYKPKTGLLHSKWVGLAKFKFLFEDDRFIRVFRNTLAMGVINLIATFVMAILFAILLNEVRNTLVKKGIQTISYLPHFLSWIIVTSLVANVLSVEDGVLNNILLSLHVIKQPIHWLAVPKYFYNIVGWTYVWKEVGWNTIVYLGAMTAIDPCLYEAAQIDGCGRLRKIWHITLPGIKPTIIIMMIMSAGHILDANFEMPYLLKNGIIQDVATQIDIYVLKWGFTMSNFSLATAAGIFKNVVNIGLLLLANGIAKRAGEERLI